MPSAGPIVGGRSAACKRDDPRGGRLIRFRGGPGRRRRAAGTRPTPFFVDPSAEERGPYSMAVNGERQRGGSDDEMGLDPGVRGYRWDSGRRGTGGGWAARPGCLAGQGGRGPRTDWTRARAGRGGGA